MYTIGEYSRITKITVKALRLYHKKGILVPSYIDEFTSYRYYNRQDVKRGKVVSALKSMDFTLAEIAEVLSDAADESDLTDILSVKKAKIATEIERLYVVSSMIDSILLKETEAAKMTTQSEDVQIVTVADVNILTSRWQGKYAETGEAFEKLYQCVGDNTNGSPFNLYYDDEYKEIASIESCVPVAHQVDSDDFDYKCLSGGKFASMLHVGPYETLGDSYAKLIDYLKDNGKKATVPSREIYHKGPGQLLEGDPEKYVTEIQVPLLD